MSFFVRKVKEIRYGKETGGFELQPRVGNIVMTAFAGLFALIGLFGSWYTNDAGERAVILRLGAPHATTGPGLHFKLPLLDSVNRIQVRVLKHSTTSEASSRDLQQIHTEVAVNYTPAPEEVTALYTEIGPEWEVKVMDPAVNEIFKAVTARYTAEELVTKRDHVCSEISAALEERLRTYHLIVRNVSITNFDFSKEFNAAIEAKQTAEQMALKAQRDLERIRTEAEQKIAAARGEAEALKVQKEQVTPMLLQLRAIEKWDGTLPQVTGGAMPFIQVGGVTK